MIIAAAVIALLPADRAAGHSGRWSTRTVVSEVSGTLSTPAAHYDQLYSGLRVKTPTDPKKTITENAQAVYRKVKLYAPNVTSTIWEVHHLYMYALMYKYIEENDVEVGINEG